MHQLVDPTQFAFIKEKYILDNTLAANEIIYTVKKSKQIGVVLKVNFEKVYDRLDWEFILKMQHSRKFEIVWTN
jgi:hypothetical protein